MEETLMRSLMCFNQEEGISENLQISRTLAAVFLLQFDSKFHASFEHLNTK